MKKKLFASIIAASLMLTACNINVNVYPEASESKDDNAAIEASEEISEETVEEVSEDTSEEASEEISEEANEETSEDIAEVPGVPSIELIEESLNSFLTWAGLQSFYEGIETESLNEDVAVPMAAFAAQTNIPEYVLTEDGCFQVISKEELDEAMMDLFGTTFDVSLVSDKAQESGMITVSDDGGVLVSLGDWGLVWPELEITSIDKASEDDEEFFVSARYYAYNYEDDTIVDTIPSYVCNFRCIPDDNSRYGFIIVDMMSSIVE